MGEKPKPLPVIAVSLAHPSLAPFKAVPWPRLRVFAIALVPICIILAIMCSAFPILTVKPEWNHNWVGGALFFSDLLVAAALAFWVAIPLTTGEMNREASEDATAIGSPTSDERYVGISYAAAITSTGFENSLDRGWLRWEAAALCFRGYGPLFRLPADMIEDVRVATSNSLLTMMLPRVILVWRHPDGSEQNICIEARLGRSLRSLKQETRDLAEWLQEGRYRGAGNAATSEADQGLPFRSTDTLKAVSFRPAAVTASDHFIALGAAAGIYLLLILASAFIAIALHLRSALAAFLFVPVIGFIVYFATIVNRQKAHGAEGRSEAEEGETPKGPR